MQYLVNGKVFNENEIEEAKAYEEKLKAKEKKNEEKEKRFKELKDLEKEYLDKAKKFYEDYGYYSVRLEGEGISNIFDNFFNDFDIFK